MVEAAYRLAYMIEFVYGDGYVDKEQKVIDANSENQPGKSGGLIIFLLLLTTFGICCTLLNNKISKVGCVIKCKGTC